MKKLFALALILAGPTASAADEKTAIPDLWAQMNKPN